MTIRTIWLREFYDPSKSPTVDTTQAAYDEDRVLEAMKLGKLTANAVVMYLGMGRNQVSKHQTALARRGAVVAVGQGGAKRYLVNVSVGNAAISGAKHPTRPPC